MKRALIPVDRDDVETTGQCAKIRAGLKKSCGSAPQPSPLGDGDRCESIAEGRATSYPHFNENQAILLKQDQIDFAERASEISTQQFESLGLQELERDVLPIPACV